MDLVPIRPPNDKQWPPVTSQQNYRRMREMAGIPGVTGSQDLLSFIERYCEFLAGQFPQVTYGSLHSTTRVLRSARLILATTPDQAI